jgi:hypothetical protein
MITQYSAAPKSSVILTLALVAVFLAAILPAAAQDGSFAGIISKINPPCEIMEAGTNTRKDLMDTDKHRPVASGDQLRCKGEGQIVIRQGPGPLNQIVITKDSSQQRDGWVLVQRSAVLNSIAEELAPAVTRNGDQPIYSPPSGGTARASGFLVRWNPWPGINQITISVWSKITEQKICCDGNFDGTNGSFASPELRKALMPLRDRSAEDRKMVLNIKGSMLRDFLVNFSLLSATEEAQLDRELATWKSKDALLRYLGRAHVFSNYRLFTQAAEESEAALAIEPKSPYLLGLAIEAEHRTGNAAPLNELKRRLAAAQSKGNE